MKTIIITTSLMAVAICSSQAATVTIGGGSFASMRNSGGNTLPDGSIIQVGYFLGVSASKSGADFTSGDWDSFVPFLGVESLSAGTDIRTFTAGPGFEAVFQFNQTFDTDTDSAVLPDNYPVRLGFRIFDAQGATTAGANFNTVVRDVSTWQFNNPVPPVGSPAPTPPSPTINSTGDTFMFWQDATNPFRTSIAAIPEASTALSMLLGLALLTGVRRRK